MENKTYTLTGLTKIDIDNITSALYKNKRDWEAYAGNTISKKLVAEIREVLNKIENQIPGI